MNSVHWFKKINHLKPAYPVEISHDSSLNPVMGLDDLYG